MDQHRSSARTLPRAALGQSRRFGRQPTTSGPPPGADILKDGRHVAEGPEADKSYAARTLIDQFVRTRKERVWEIET